MHKLKVRIRKLPSSKDLPLPVKASSGSSGFDLLACIESEIEIPPGEFALVPTGLSVQIPPGYEAQVRPRSGLAVNRGITVLNSPGTVDSDYRGELGVVLINHGKEVFRVRRGDRIAQIAFSKVCDTIFEEVETLEDSRRGEGGFGHTGV